MYMLLYTLYLRGATQNHIYHSILHHISWTSYYLIISPSSLFPFPFSVLYVTFYYI